MKKIISTSRVNEFRIWRIGHPIDWQCTAHEVAQQLDLRVITVIKICRRKGWPIETHEEPPIDYIFKK